MKKKHASLIENKALIWVALSLVKAIAKLKPEKQLKLGRQFGRLLQKVLPKHRKYAAINLKLCFPKESEEFRSKLANQYFESFGMGLLEFCMAAFTPANKLPPCKTQGFEYVEEAIKENKPIIFVSAHFSTMIMMGRLISEHLPFSAVFRLQRDGLFNKLLIKYAADYGVSLIPPKLPQILKRFSQEKKILYFIDQDHGQTYSAFAPFFGIQTATIKALPYLAKNVKNAVVIPVFCYRKLDPLGYELAFLPPLTDYPSQIEEENATHINQVLEAAIRKQPELYFWYYKRFRTRPNNEPGFYD